MRVHNLGSVLNDEFFFLSSHNHLTKCKFYFQFTCDMGNCTRVYMAKAALRQIHMLKVVYIYFCEIHTCQALSLYWGNLASTPKAICMSIYKAYVYDDAAAYVLLLNGYRYLKRVC